MFGRCGFQEFDLFESDKLNVKKLKLRSCVFYLKIIFGIHNTYNVESINALINRLSMVSD